MFLPLFLCYKNIFNIVCIQWKHVVADLITIRHLLQRCETSPRYKEVEQTADTDIRELDSKYDCCDVSILFLIRLIKPY